MFRRYVEDSPAVTPTPTASTSSAVDVEVIDNGDSASQPGRLDLKRFPLPFL